jgi:ABC-type transport system involved in multi-copper enzyme maturation permease subunit
MNIITVAKDQAGDLLRRRYLLVIFIGALAIIGMWIGYLALMKSLFPMMQKGAQDAASKGMGEMMMGGLQVALHAIVGSIGVLLALGLMCYSVTSEVSRGTVRMILSRPVKRYEFFLGKWLGCVCIVAVYALLVGILVCSYTYWGFGHLQPVIPLSIAMMFLKAITVGSIGMALAMLLRPIVGLLIAYLAAGETFLFIAWFTHGIVKGIMRALFYVLPSYKAFDLYGGIMNGTSMGGTEIAYRVAYALLLSALMLAIGAAVFQRKDLI